MNLLPTKNAEPLALARSLALLIGLAVVAASGLAWGPTGTLAAATGSLIAIANVWVLERLGARARREAGDSEDAHASERAVQAGSRLQVAMAAKTIILLGLVALLAQLGVAARAMTPFSLGLLVSVFALIAGGLLGRPEAEQQAS